MYSCAFPSLLVASILVRLLLLLFGLGVNGRNSIDYLYNPVLWYSDTHGEDTKVWEALGHRLFFERRNNDNPSSGKHLSFRDSFDTFLPIACIFQARSSSMI